MLGYHRHEIMNMCFSVFTHPDDQAGNKLKFMELLHGRTRAYRVEERYIRKDGQTLWARTYVRGIYNQEGVLQYIIGMIEDITDQVRSEEEMRKLVEHLQVMYDATPDMLFLHGEDGLPVYANERACKALGYELGELLRLSPDAISGSGYSFGAAKSYIDKAMAGKAQEFEWMFRAQDGSEFPVEVRLAPLTHVDHQTGGKVLAIVRDISEKKKAEAALRESEELIRYRANYDELTNLPNRYNFMQQLESALALNDRREKMVGLLYLDLDRFKNVNDTLGHHVGDALLEEVASRLQKTLRVTDTVARLGGDEFTVLLQDLTDDISPLIIAENIIAELEKPFHIDGHEIFTGTSIGITLAPNDGDDAHTLLKNADMAMYKAKEQGRNTFQYFTRELTAKAEHYVAMEKELRRALHQGEFAIYYQPVINLGDERIAGVEALVRWNHPDRGIVSPAEFIPIAEESNLIIDLGEWVLRNACAEVRRWNISDLHLAVNVSSNQLRGGFNRQVVEDILEHTQFPAERLVFEITESLLMEEEDEVTRTLMDFRDLSIHLSVDDFGTGYSSLSYLRRFPVNILKIDRSFVRDMETDPGDAQLVETIIGMASNLNLRVVAEGVESEVQAGLLREQGCDMVQGFYYGKPQPGEEIIRLFQKQNPPIYPSSFRPEERHS
jgi:diguanylate cyclase (GGDEF)-like protein/PAS domain S-box-containing protein